MRTTYLITLSCSPMAFTLGLLIAEYWARLRRWLTS